MDTLTHIVLGACAGEALAGKKLGKKAMLFGAIANNIPDADVLSSIWLKPPDTLLAHRGFTHSFLFAGIMTLFSGWLMKKIFRKNAFTLGEWFILFGVNIFLHLLIDAFTVYGTGWFEPFSNVRISFNMLFVADPFYTLPLLVAAIALLILSRSSPVRMKWAKAGLWISSLYVVYALFHKVSVDGIARTSLNNQHIAYSSFMSTPAPLNNFLWYIVAVNDSGYHIGYHSVFDHSGQVAFRYIPRNDSLLKSTDNLNKLIRFSKGMYQLQKINDSIVFNDLRFGQIGGWDDANAPFVFQFKMSDNADNSMVIQSGRLRASRSEALRSMIRRIRGN